MVPDINITENSPSELLAQLEKEIRSDQNILPPDKTTIESITLSIHNENILIGGLYARIPGDWLHITMLWVAKNKRRFGIGKTLVQKAENEAITRGCKHSMLEASTSETKDFYIKQGYEIYAELTDFPVEFETRYYLKKHFP
ncbi:MAG: GNAT family N-acetyltransferase [Desulfobulbaceae bacterium]|nr:GNAT family N-acetyltransferase [Desulfobulbaceae bacterium]HIJ78323.1 GNAT family N-acetyltransferase [Deltaproteobacteria bacterium]